MFGNRFMSFLKLATLVLLATAAVVTNLGGLVDGWLQPIGVPGPDIYQRFTEWKLVADGIYPMRGVASADEMARPDFRSSVYPPWAFPMLGLVFSWSGYAGGKLFIFVVSLLSLLVFAWVGWNYLRPLGAWAAMVGALAPLAILGNRFCFSHAQFSIFCMALISLQWILIARGRYRLSTLCWVIAMLKPQMAMVFVLPLLKRGRLAALAMGIGILAALSLATFIHTTTSPLELWARFYRVLPYFVSSANSNLSALLLWLIVRPVFALLLIGLVVLLCAVIVSRSSMAGPLRKLLSHDANSMDFAALCAVVGYVGVYHQTYDKIMLYPLLLVCLKGVLSRPNLLSSSRAFAAAALLWLPERWLAVFPTLLGQTFVLMGLGLWLAIRLVQPAPVLADSSPIS
jgi:hypothetical protein